MLYTSFNYYMLLQVESVDLLSSTKPLFPYTENVDWEEHSTILDIPSILLLSYRYVLINENNQDIGINGQHKCCTLLHQLYNGYNWRSYIYFPKSTVPKCMHALPYILITIYTLASCGG